MSSSQTRHPLFPVPDTLTIQNWPLRDDFLLSLSMIVAFVVISWMTLLMVQSVGAAGAAFMALSVASWRMWLPVTFQFNRQGFTQIVLGRKRFISWRSVGQFKVYRHGILLLADEELYPLSPLHSIFVRWNDRKVELLNLVRFAMDPRLSLSLSSTQTYEPE